MSCPLSWSFLLPLEYVPYGRLTYHCSQKFISGFYLVPGTHNHKYPFLTNRRRVYLHPHRRITCFGVFTHIPHNPVLGDHESILYTTKRKFPNSLFHTSVSPTLNCISRNRLSSLSYS